MELRPLRHAVALAHHLHFGRAAHALGLTQPALSRSIQLTEERYGVTLFERDRRNVRLTAAGRAFVDRAADLLRDAEEFERAAHSYAIGANVSITFGVSPSAARSYLPPLLTELARERHDFEINVAVRRTSSLVTMLLAEEIEFLICAKSQVPATADASFCCLGIYHACFVVRPGHPLLADDALDIAHFPVVAAGPADRNDELMRGLLNFYEHRPRIMVESAEALARLTEGSEAVWLSSTFAAADELARGSLVRLDRQDARANQVEVGIFRLRHRTSTATSMEIERRLRALLGTA